MSPQLRAKMEEWLATGNESQKQLARHKLSQPPEPPPLLTRLTNFAAAVVSHVAAGMPEADEETVAARLAVCNGPPAGPPCDQRLAGGTCAGCGCNLAMKASWLDQKCPEGRWPD